MNRNVKVLFRSLIANTILVIIKIIGGIVGKSQALVADGIHSLSDLGTDIFAMVGSKLSTKKADKDHPFGHGNIEFLVCLFIAIVIIMLGAGLVINSIKPNTSKPDNIVIYVTIIAIIIKYLLVRYLLKKGYQYEDNILIASGKESAADLIGAFVVILSVVIGKITNNVGIFKYSDAFGAISIGLIIVYTGLKIFWHNIIAILGEKEEDEVIVKLVKDKILMVKGVDEIKKIILLKFGPYYKCDLVIAVNPKLTVLKLNKITNEVRKKIINKETRIKYLVVSAKPEMRK
jgi:cation diffusion facilitator family transporter